MSTELSNEQLTQAFEYLDELRESGETNMFGATTYVVDHLEFTLHDAREAVSLWMKTFTGDTTVKERVESASAS